MKSTILSFIVFTIFSCIFCHASSPSAASGTDGTNRKIFVGKVTEVDLEDETVTVVWRSKSITFHAASARFKGYETLRGIKKGDKVRVEYEEYKDNIDAKFIIKLKGMLPKKESPVYYF